MAQQNIRMNERPAIHQRICWVGAYKGEYCLGRFICRALRQMGYVVEVIDHRQHRDRLGELLQNVNADLVIVSRGEGIPPALVGNLPCPTVLWYGEYIHGNDEQARARRQEVQYNAPVFDYVVWCGEENPESLQLLRNLGCNRVGYGYPCRFDPAIYRKLDLPKVYDVSFVGALTPRRKHILETLARRFRVEFRNIWDLEEQVRFYNQSRIVLHITSFPFINIAGVNIRTFDILGSGTLLLHEDVVFPSVFEKQFEDRKHLVYWHFDDVGDLADKIEHYLTHEEERERIAEAGYRFVHENFSVEQSVQNLLRRVDFSLRAPTLTGEGYGVAFDKWGRQTRSVNELHKALEPVASSAHAHSFYERGNLYFQLQRWEKACRVLEQAVDMDGHFVKAMYLLALSYIRLERLREAVRELRRLLKVAPFHAEANLTLGELYSALGDAEQGNYYQQKGLKLAPKRTC